MKNAIGLYFGVVSRAAREKRKINFLYNAIFKGRMHFLCTKVSFKKAFIKKIASNIQKGRFWTDTMCLERMHLSDLI